MPKDWEHWWEPVNGKTRKCSKCGVQQTKLRTTQGQIAIRLSNATWEPKVQKKCGGTNG